MTKEKLVESLEKPFGLKATIRQGKLNPKRCTLLFKDSDGQTQCEIVISQLDNGEWQMGDNFNIKRKPHA